MVINLVGKKGSGKSTFGAELCMQTFALGAYVCTNMKFNLEAVTAYLLNEHKYEFDPSQYIYLHPWMIPNFWRYTPKGTAENWTLVLIEEALDWFHRRSKVMENEEIENKWCADWAKVRSGDLPKPSDCKYIPRLITEESMDFLRRCRHHYTHVYFITQHERTLHADVWDMTDEYWRLSDMRGKRIAGLPFDWKISTRMRTRYDKEGEEQAHEVVTWKPEVWKLYDSFETEDGLTRITVGSHKGRSIAKEVEDVKKKEAVVLCVACAGLALFGREVMTRKSDVDMVQVQKIIKAEVEDVRREVSPGAGTPGQVPGQVQEPMVKRQYERFLYVGRSPGGQPECRTSDGYYVVGDRSPRGKVVVVKQNVVVLQRDDGGFILVHDDLQPRTYTPDPLYSMPNETTLAKADTSTVNAKGALGRAGAAVQGGPHRLVIKP